MVYHIVQNIEDYYKQMMNIENKDKLIICYFTAKWCGPCKLISKDVEEIGSKSDLIVVLKIDVDDCEEVSNQCNIDCMPTFKFHIHNSLEPYKELMGADKTQLFNIIGDLLQNLESHQEKQNIESEPVSNLDNSMEVPNMYNPLPNHEF